MTGDLIQRIHDMREKLEAIRKRFEFDYAVDRHTARRLAYHDLETLGFDSQEITELLQAWETGR